jgi:peptidoglycan hydrolase-like protein with peptidoglycan-binding domain
VKQPDLAVRQVQGILREQGYDPGLIDGLMGNKTRTALRQFQLDHQLPQTGRIDPATKAALFQ